MLSFVLLIAAFFAVTSAFNPSRFAVRKQVTWVYWIHWEVKSVIQNPLEFPVNGEHCWCCSVGGKLQNSRWWVALFYFLFLESLMKVSETLPCWKAAVQAAGLVETLSKGGPFTVFAPTDAAFAKLPAGTVDGKHSQSVEKWWFTKAFLISASPSQGHPQAEIHPDLSRRGRQG